MSEPATSEPQRLAADLLEGDLAAAGLLVALCDAGPVNVPKEDSYLLRELERRGCVEDGRHTPLGARVAIVLRANGVSAKLEPRERTE